MQASHKFTKLSPETKHKQEVIVKKWTATLIGALLISGSAAAQEIYYVTDQLTITMRSGESTQHKIIRSLKSGTKLEIIENNKDSGFSRARTQGGTEGWVLTRFLTTQPSARQRLETANNTIKQLNKELPELRSEVNKSNSERSSLSKTSNSLEKENKKLNKELTQIKEISRNAIALDEDNKNLREKLIRLETDLQAMEQHNSILKDRSSRDWFITGTFVTIFGILIGLLVPRMRVKPKSKWNEL